MPNQRREGVVVTSYTVESDLLAQAQAKATDDDTTVTQIIRAALSRYVGETP